MYIMKQICHIVFYTIFILQCYIQANEEVSYKSKINIINKHIKVELDPSVQHIPLIANQSHLRPPPPIIPSSFDIFIGLSVFRDGYRCGTTIFTGFSRAAQPERLYFGVIDQVALDDIACIDAYCKMAEEHWPNKGSCPYRDHIRIDSHPAEESRGPTLARHYQQKLLRNEEFCLQLDGHSVFTNHWDIYLLEEWKRVNNEMAILSTYLHHIHDFVKPNGDNGRPYSLPHLCTTIRGSNGLVRNEGASMISDSKFPQLQALWGAGLSFGKCHAERRVLVDSHTLWMFDGEEFLRSSHLWTHGYDMYSPSYLGSVVYHNYTKVPARFEHVKVDPKQKAMELEMSRNRFKLIVGQPFRGNVDATDLEKYGFGTVRTFKQYLEFSGVNFIPGKNDTHTCKQLHWVPYTNPNDVEEIMQGTWHLHEKAQESTPMLNNGKPEVQIVQTTQTTTTHVIHVDTGANNGETKEMTAQPKLRQHLHATGLPIAQSQLSLSLLVLTVVLFLFVGLSNDSISVWMRHQICLKPKASTN